MNATIRLLLAGAIVLFLLPFVAPAQPVADTVHVLEIKGGIGPATRDYLRRGLERAAGEGSRVVVLKIDTPGGLDAATRDINQDILASPVPVIGWVTPEGARAASAGTYIIYASHLAAMAPATSLGAATPVSMGGGTPGGDPPGRPSPSREGSGEETPSGEPPAGDEASKENEEKSPAPRAGSSAMERKVVNDAVSYLRSLAELRGRDADFAEAAVREASTLTASQALERGVVEVVAADLASLLAQADGRTVNVLGKDVVLDTADLTVVAVEPDWRSRLLSVITDPSVAYLLLLVGMYGLVFEGYSPGAIVPGVVGAICLLLALYAMQVLPVNYVGVLLIVLAVVLMVTEMMVPSFGALGIGGLIALIAGSLLLFDTGVPGFGLPGQLVLGVGMASGLGFLGVLYLAMRVRKRPVLTGEHELVGHLGVAARDFQGHGDVMIRGETWQAESAQPVQRGQSVRVLGIQGLVLQVEPVAAEAGHPVPNH